MSFALSARELFGQQFLYMILRFYHLSCHLWTINCVARKVTNIFTKSHTGMVGSILRDHWSLLLWYRFPYKKKNIYRLFELLKYINTKCGWLHHFFSAISESLRKNSRHVLYWAGPCHMAVASVTFFFTSLTGSWALSFLGTPWWHSQSNTFTPVSS